MFLSVSFTLLLYSYIHLANSGSDSKDWENRLGSEIFLEREKASRELQQISNKNPLRYLPMLRRIKASPDLEVRRRARDVLQRVRLKEILDSFEPFPCIDAAWYEWGKGKGFNPDSSVCKELYVYLRQQPNYSRYEHFDGGWVGYRYATRLWFRDRLIAGTPIWKLRLVHLEMHYKDHKAHYGYWQKEYNKLFYPPMSLYNP